MKKLFVVALGTLLLTTSSQAAIIYSGLQNIPIPATFEGVYLNLDTGATSTSSMTGWDLNAFFGGAGLANSPAFQPARNGTVNDDAVMNLMMGSVVDGNLLYSTGYGGSGDRESHLGSGAGQFTVGTEGYLGFRFTTDSSNGPYYGWMRVLLTNNTSGAQIVDWAYENSGGSIQVGVGSVPEPSRAALLLLGGAGILVRRKRRIVG